MIKRASVTTLKVLKAAALVTLETLEVLVDILTDPSKAYTYCDKVGVPPFAPSAEWKPVVTRLREKADVAKTPEDWAEITALAIKIIGGINDAISNPDAPGPGKVEAALTKLVMPALLYAIPKAHFPGNVLVYAILAGAYFTDQRLQDSYPQGLFAERWGAMLGDLAVKAGWGRKKEGEEGEEEVEADWGPITSDSLALACVIVTLVLEMDSFKRRLIRFWYGFDHPDIPELPEARKLAQHAFTLLLNAGEQEIEVADFDKPLRDQPPEEPSAPLALTLVPVPATETTPSKLYVQVRGQADINEELGAGFKLRVTNGASFGVLASRDGLEPTGNVSFQAELLREEPVQQAREPREEGSALEFRVVKLSVGARVSVDEIAAWVRVQQGELVISGGSWLDDFVPRLKFMFDVTAEASVLNGVRFKGGAGGDVLIPINQKIPILIGNVRLQAVRIKAILGDIGGEMTFGLEASAQLTLELFKILKVHVSGIGAAYRTGMAKEGDGNIAGVAKMGWAPVLPQGAGIELKVWKIEGGGALFYDAAKERLSGAMQLHFGKKFSLTGLGIYQRATAGGPRSWLVVVSMQLPQSGSGFQFAGLGLLYGSNRSTSPEAFLAGLTTGDLDAVLFPDDPVGKAPQYLAALERLFPTKENSTVLGISAKFTALGGRLSLDVGVIIEGSDLARMYIVAQFVGLLKKPKPGEDPLSQPVRVLADGVAIWDSQTDEMNLRIMLRNSRVWAGELTGGASLFHGSPQTDGQDRGTYISVGGFHPDYVPPGTKIFVPPRLSLVLSKGDHLKLEMRAYLAFTPSSLQFGASGSIEARLYGFGIRGRLSLDVLIGFDGTFNLKIEFSVELLLGSKSIAAVRFVGTVEGFTPTVLSGKVEVKFLFWTLSKHGSKTLYEGDAPEESVIVQDVLAAAAADAANWDSGGAPGLTLTDRDRNGVWLSPTEPLRFRQPVVPLNVPIERFGAVKLPGAVTLRIEGVRNGPGELRTNPLPGEFALGMFLNLTQEEMLSSRGFEARDAGVELVRTLENGDAVTTSAEFEEIMLDPLKRPETPPPMTVVLGNLSVFARDGVRAVTPVKVRRERFAVVDDVLQPQGDARGFFEARAALRPGLRMVPEAEVVA